MKEKIKTKRAEIRLPPELWEFCRNLAHISHKSMNEVFVSAINKLKNNIEKSVDSD